MIHVGVGAIALVFLAVTAGVGLVSQPRFGADDMLPRGPVIIRFRDVLYPVAVDFIKSKTNPILPDWRPDHPAVAVDAHHANAEQEKDRQHLDQTAASLVLAVAFTCF